MERRVRWQEGWEGPGEAGEEVAQPVMVSAWGCWYSVSERVNAPLLASPLVSATSPPILLKPLALRVLRPPASSLLQVAAQPVPSGRGSSASKKSSRPKPRKCRGP